MVTRSKTVGKRLSCFCNKRKQDLWMRAIVSKTVGFILLRCANIAAAQ